MKLKFTIMALFIFMSLIRLSYLSISTVGAEESLHENQKIFNNLNSKSNGISTYTIFDDKKLLEGYSHKYYDLSKEILLAMIKDDTLTSYKSAAAVRVFRQKYSAEVVSKEKKRVERILLRRLSRTESAFVELETMHTLCILDRYRYFKTMVPALIQKLDHYNQTVNELAFEVINYIIESGHNRPREARIIFNRLRKALFLERKRLENVTEPSLKLSQKLKLIRWSIKVLGSQELKRLPKEVINLL